MKFASLLVLSLLTFSATALVSTAAFAAPGDLEVYNALVARETPLPTPAGVAGWVKSAAGIRCTKYYYAQTASTEYNCTLPKTGPRAMNAEAVWTALAGNGIPVPTPYGKAEWQKNVGWIRCTKIQTFGADFTTPITTSYSCRFNK
jgi:hypothetical protein